MKLDLISRAKSLILVMAAVVAVAVGASEFGHRPHHLGWLILDVAGGALAGAVATWRPR